MSTEKRSRNPRSAAVSAEDQPQRPQALAGTHRNQSRPLRTPCCGWCAAHTAALREKSSRRARISPLLWSPADEQTIIANAWLLVPEGRRRKLAGGEPAQGAAPGCAAERAMPQRGIEEIFGGIRPAAFPPSLGTAGLFLRCPVGARSQAAPLPGAASAAADLPPANLLRCPSGTENGRSRPAPENPRRTNGVPNSSSCGSGAVCPSSVCISTAATPLNRFA